VRLRLFPRTKRREPFGDEFERILRLRTTEADEFYAGVVPANLSDQERLVSRQAYAGCCGASSSITMSCEIGSTVIRVNPARRNRASTDGTMTGQTCSTAT